MRMLELDSFDGEIEMELWEKEGIQLITNPHPHRAGQICYVAKIVPIKKHRKRMHNILPVDHEGNQAKEPIALKLWEDKSGCLFLTMDKKYSSPPSLPFDINYILARGEKKKKKMVIRELFFELKYGESEKTERELPIIIPPPDLASIRTEPSTPRFISLVSVMSSFEQRANIKFCVKLIRFFTDTLVLMNEAYGDEKLSQTQIYFWYKGFKHGRKNNADY
ncbi:hypothetical protein LAZ67_2006782 [Cordylochernes scorpioides]|uniref:Uncharacterized protein n=1 Tax=Cordylochernes scorpioides TaxID=51811 RepID=A0ABY6K5N5_9ARAC|nr:hypothetical protein LAZ67_2006782 [Cordylochernes scorpioides]